MSDVKQSKKQAGGRWLEIEEVRIISDLRIMHAKVDDLYHIVNSLKQHHDEKSIFKYADHPLLAKDIKQVDEIYLWFVALKEQRRKMA